MRIMRKGNGLEALNSRGGGGNRHLPLNPIYFVSNQSVIGKLGLYDYFCVFITPFFRGKKLINVPPSCLSMTDQKSYEWNCDASAWIILGL